jgi:predicted DNA-binding transcriptional regulator YafY
MDLPTLAKETGLSERLVKDGIKRLKHAGIPIKFSRKDDFYRLPWPTGPVKLDLSPKALFLLKMAISRGVDVGEELNLVDQIIDSTDTLPVFDHGPAYGIGQGVNPGLKEHFKVIQQARRAKKCLVFLYEAPGKDADIRTVEPIYLYHTPISWYLISYCIDRHDLRSFKLARMKHLKVTKESIEERPFMLSEFLGDAWWVQKGKVPMMVEVLFLGEAEKSIMEYKFHASQECRGTSEGTLVTWKLSYLGEFASWLLQWAGQIKIISPEPLKKELQSRIDQYLKHNS